MTLAPKDIRAERTLSDPELDEGEAKWKSKRNVLRKSNVSTAAFGKHSGLRSTRIYVGLERP